MDSDASANDIKEEDMRFLCGCGQCSLESFILNGCPHPWEKSRFPLLNIKHMSVAARLELLGRLTDESEEVTSKFGSLVRKVLVSLKNGTVDVKELVVFLLPQQKFLYLEEAKRIELENKLDQASTVGDVLSLLTKNFISWFNHPLLGSIAKEFTVCENEYQNYVNEVFIPFIRRSLFEVPSNSFSPNELQGSGKFLLKIHIPKPKASFEAGFLLPLRRHVSKVLCIAIDGFDICSYEKGCVQLTVAVPLTLLQEIFPVPDCVIHLLSTFCYEGVQIRSIAFDQHYHPVPIKV